MKGLSACLICAVLFPGFSLEAGEDYEKARIGLINEIQEEVRATSEYLGKSTLDVRVLEALHEVPRHSFVPLDQQSFAYDNRPLPIGYGQTISQPYIVAIMTDLLQLKPEDSVLEIGTGSGYQAAVLARLVAKVCTIEIIGALADQAGQRLKDLGYSNIKTRHGDGYYGWETEAPFDAIMVTAAADHVPPPLLKQLKPGGRMMIPVGGKFTVQQLVLIEKDMQDKVTLRHVLPVRFVPLTHGQ